MPEPITIGKFRGLQQCSTARGAIAILALDHRNNLRNALNPADPAAVTNQEMIAFKQQVTSVLAPVSSAMLLDPEVGGLQCIATGALPGSTGLVMALEATGYSGESFARRSVVLQGWSVAQARRMGASAVKLLVYYHPDSTTASQTETLVKQIAQECQVEDIPFFLEILTYSIDPSQKNLNPVEHRQVVLASARRLVQPGVDVLKAEFPLDTKSEPDEREWAKACAELSATSHCPWILLSASVDFETYLHQVTIACQNGASGVAVGRAVWQEATGLTGNDRQRFLEQIARPRMARLTALCNALARPWREFCVD